MRSWPFFAIALKRLKSRFSLSLLVALSASLAIAIVTCVPAFSGGVSLRIMQQEIEGRAKRHDQPLLSVRAYAMGSRQRPVDIDEALYYREWIKERLQHELDLPIDSVYMQIESPEFPLLPHQGDQHYSDVIDRIAVTYIQDLEEHIEIIAGVPFGSQELPETLTVWVERHYADRIGLQVGETYVLQDKDSGRGDLPLRIAGFWQARAANERFWYLDPANQLSRKLLTTRSQYETHVYPRAPQMSAFSSWYYVFADKRVNLAHAEHYLDGLENVGRQVGERLPGGSLDHAPTDELLKGNERKKALSLILLGFSLPVIAIVLYFVGVLSAMVVHFQMQELSMLTSRGSSRSQILLLTLIETVLILVVATPIGLTLGLALARLLGNSLGFLRFAPREPLPVHLASVEWWILLAAILVTALSRLVPTWLASRQTIITHERQRARVDWRMGLGRLLLIVFLALTSWYSFRRLAAIGTLSLVSWEPGEANHDPLLLLAPSLFLLTVPLVASELFVILVRPLAWLGKLLPGLAAYLGLTDLGRNGAQYRRPIYMLVLCLGLGIFYASLAKSADNWLLDRREYQVGTDLTFFPEWDTDLEKYGLTEEEILEVWGRPWEVRMSEYESIAGVSKAAPVGEYSIPSLRVPSRYIRVLAIDRLEFPRVVRYRSHYGPQTLGQLMNRLATKPNALLVAEDVAARMSWQVGDQLSFTMEIDKRTRLPVEFEIVGTFEYFPTRMNETDYLLVTNLDYLQSQAAHQLPFSVWLRLAPGIAPADVLQVVNERFKILPTWVHELDSLVVADGERLERVGIFGMLSICFLTGALLAALGLVIHSAAAMKGRSLRFAILQALGMARTTLMSTIFIQYLVMMLYSIVVGAGLGILCSQLYGPFFQLTDTAAVPVPPYSPLVDQERAIQLALTMTAVLVLIEAALFVHLLRSRVFEILRLGTRE